MEMSSLDKMENFLSNVTLNSSKPEVCEFGSGYVAALSLIDIITFLVGQPVVIRVLWSSYTSKKPIDILNCNLALYHYLQYWFAIVHLCVLHLKPNSQNTLLKFLLVYSMFGGPMSLSFICLERYVAVIHPLFYPLLKTYRFREVAASLVWLFSVPIALLSSVVGNSLHALRETLTRDLPLAWLLGMNGMMVHCSICILKTLVKSGPGGDKMSPQKRRAFKTVCATSVTNLMCYFPVTVLQQYGFDEMVFECLVTPLCILFLSAASVVHPIFYLSAQGKLFTCFK